MTGTLDEARARAAQLAHDPMLVYAKKTLVVRGPRGIFRLDTERFGRQFWPFGVLVRQARVRRGIEQVDVARAISVDKALISTLEGGTHGKLRLSFVLVGNLTHALDLDLPVSESYLAYVSEVYAEARALYYPDDPGSLGPKLGLPLRGASERIAAREKRA